MQIDMSGRSNRSSSKSQSKSSRNSRKRGLAAFHRVNKKHHHRTTRKVIEENLQHQNIDVPLVDESETNSES